MIDRYQPENDKWLSLCHDFSIRPNRFSRRNTWANGAISRFMSTDYLCRTTPDDCLPEQRGVPARPWPATPPRPNCVFGPQASALTWLIYSTQIFRIFWTHCGNVKSDTCWWVAIPSYCMAIAGLPATWTYGWRRLQKTITDWGLRLPFSGC